jgi:prolipoprotein diacylglyceryltransferase
MYPDLIDLGFLHIKTYGACMATGFLICWTLIERLSGRKDLSNMLLSLMISGVLGSRIAYVIEH